MNQARRSALGDAAADRWFGVGSSCEADPVLAGAEATKAALIGADPKLTVVFCAVSFPLQPLVNQIQALTPGVPMIGCTTAGEIATNSVSDGTVTVCAFGGDFTIATAVALGASDDSAMSKTYQIHDGQVLENAVVSASIGSTSPMGIGVQHGWRAKGEPMLVGRTQGTAVLELDGRRALEVYLERATAPKPMADNEEAFTNFAMTHPLGLRRGGAEEVRFINGADFETGALTSIAEIPQGTLVWLMEGDRASVLEGTRASCADALQELEDHEPIGLLLFDCIARRTVLGDVGVEAEMASVGAVFPPVPTAGFYTYGEIARTSGIRGFHNQTLVTLAFS